MQLLLLIVLICNGEYLCRLSSSQILFFLFIFLSLQDAARYCVACYNRAEQMSDSINRSLTKAPASSPSSVVLLQQQLLADVREISCKRFLCVLKEGNKSCLFLCFFCVTRARPWLYVGDMVVVRCSHFSLRVG